MIWKGVTQDIPREERGKEEDCCAAAPICDIMADTLSVLYGTTENRNDRECDGRGRCGAVQHRDLTQFNSRQCAQNSRNRDKFYMSNRSRGEKWDWAAKTRKLRLPSLPRSESRESNAAAAPFEYRHATTTTTTTHMNCQLQGGCKSREQRVEHGEGGKGMNTEEGNANAASAANSSILGIGAN